MLDLAKKILSEIENNPTIREGWKTGMRVAVGYILDKVEKDLIWSYASKNSIELNGLNNETIQYHFDRNFCYDVNVTAEKKLEELERITEELT